LTREEQMKKLVTGAAGFIGMHVARRLLERSKKSVRNMLPMKAGDVLATHADIEDLRETVGLGPNTPLKEGVGKFVAWLKTYYGAARIQGGIEKEVKVLSEGSFH
jgi:nucleoside-diphosphate-sugar epimerase